MPPFAHVFFAFVDEGDYTLVPDPGYPVYKNCTIFAGGTPYAMPLKAENKFLPDFDAIPEEVAKKSKLMFLNYPNNPLGCTCDLEYLQHCVDFCNKHNIILISDAAYAEMYYDENYKPHSALECKGAMDCCIELYSFSKSYAMTGWRLGWACGNSTAITMLSRTKSTVDTGIFKVLQYTGADLLESKEGQTYIDKQNEKFKNKLQKFTDGLKSLGYNIEMPKTTFYLWLEIPKRFKDCVEFANQMLEKSGIVIVPGTAFDKNATRYVRLSVVAADKDLDEIINRMKEDGFYFEEK